MLTNKASNSIRLFSLFTGLTDAVERHCSTTYNATVDNTRQPMRFTHWQRWIQDQGNTTGYYCVKRIEQSTRAARVSATRDSA